MSQLCIGICKDSNSYTATSMKFNNDCDNFKNI